MAYRDFHSAPATAATAAPPLPDRVGDLASSEPTPTSTPPGTPSALDIRLAPMLASIDSSPLEGELDLLVTVNSAFNELD